MERPSKEAVEGALAHYVEEAQCAIERNCAGILAAEVRALREEMSVMQSGEAYQAACYLLGKSLLREATLRADLDLLPAKWRGKKPRGTGTMTTGEVAVVQYAFQDAAEDLEAALKGEP